MLLMLNAVRAHDDYTPAEAKQYFKMHEMELTAITQLVAICAGNGEESIYPGGRVLSGAGATVRCPTKEISARIRALGILWVNIDNREPYGRHGPFNTTFILTSSGTLVWGHGSAIYYFAKPEDQIPFGDSIPLKGFSGHWFFKSLGRGPGDRKHRWVLPKAN